MAKLRFDCKGKLENGDPCDKDVSTKMHKGISTAIEIQRLIKKIHSLELEQKDVTEVQKKLTVLNSVPEVPKDWQFTLTCSRGHEEDYTYDDKKED